MKKSLEVVFLEPKSCEPKSLEVVFLEPKSCEKKVYINSL